MALDSNSPGDDRSASGAATGLKLVSERGAAAGAAASAASPAGPGRPADTAAAGPTPGSSPVRRGDRKQGRQVPLWLFAALLVLFLIGFGYQTHHASQLESEVTRLEASLARAEDRLESHRTHLLEIRAGVHDLSSRLESLRAVIDRDPTVEPATPPAPKPQPPAAH